MYFKRMLILALFISSISFGSVNLQEKRLRIATLMKMQSFAPRLGFEAYQRELIYENKNLSIDQRAIAETNLLIQQIRNQIKIAYLAALKKNLNPEQAKEEIKNNMIEDLELAHPELKKELIGFATDTLNSIDQDEINSVQTNLSNTQSLIRLEVLKRSQFLNQEYMENTAFQTNGKANDKKDYKNKKELIDNLVSNDQSASWVSSSNQTIKTEEIVQNDSKISLQLKIQFLGADLSAGPTITFQRLYKTSATIIADGMTPVILNNGNFDYWKRDYEGKIVVKEGKETKRFIAFYCQADLQFQSQYTGSGGISMMGLGGQVNLSKRYLNTVTLASRRILLPESVENKSITLQSLSEICNNDFLNAQFNKTLTVKNSLNMMMKNMVASLTFSHPQNKCAVDNQCFDWFNKKLTLVKNHNTPRCVEENSVEKFRACKLRGLEGQNCPVYENNKLLSDGQREYPCDVGLKCVKNTDQSVIMGLVWTYAKGSCQVIDKKNYSIPEIETTN